MSAQGGEIVDEPNEQANSEGTQPEFGYGAAVATGSKGR